MDTPSAGEQPNELWFDLEPILLGVAALLMSLPAPP